MDKVLEILHSIRPEFDFSESTDFFADGMLDSYDMVVLVSELDKGFGISINGVDIIPENFENASTILALLQKYGVTA